MRRVIVGATVLAALSYLFCDHLLLLGLSAWVMRFDHGTIELTARDEKGNVLDAVAFLRRWLPMLIVRDPAGTPVFGMQYGLGTPRVAVPPGQPVTLELLWEVPGFGKVLVDADNDGHGYRVPAHGRVRIELLPALARSRLSELRTWVDVHNHGAFASREAGRAYDTASALARGSDRGDVREQTMRWWDALRLALQASEDEVLAEARAVIRTRRRGELRIGVADAKGTPLANVAVNVRQQRFDFLFGVFSDPYDSATVARLNALGLNYAILFMTWGRTEPQPGHFAFDDFDRFFALPEVTNNGFTVCGHALVWLANGEVPAYLGTMRGRTADLVAATREHVGGIVRHYKHNVQIWEAINEGHPQWSRWGLDDAGLVQIAKASAEEIRREAPGTPIMVEVTLPLGEDVALKHYPLIGLVSSGRIGAASSEPYRYLEHLAEAGVPYDILALQIYNGAWMHIAWGIQVPAIDLFRFARILDRYGRLGKPLQIAEIAVGSDAYGTAFESWWHAKPSQRTQADYLEQVFTVAYGNPQVQGINWWGLDDTYRFVEAGGLFDESRRPKLAAVRLAELLRGWRSNGIVHTGADGWTSFNGTAGLYRVTAQVGAQLLSTDAHVTQGRTTTVVMHMPARDQAAEPSHVNVSPIVARRHGSR